MMKSSTLFFATLLLAPLAGCTGGDDSDDTGNDSNPTTTATAGDDGMTGDDGDDDGDDGDDGMTDEGMTDDADTGTESEGGDDGGPDVAVCQYECAADADCTVAGMDIGLTCGANDSCFSPCAADLDCQLFPATECTTNMECADAFQGVCVDFGDTDFCVAEEDPMTNCEALMQTAIDATDVDGNTVTVCSPTPDSTCGDVNGDMACSVPAVAFSCEFCPESFTCDEAAETCECGTTADCEAAMFPGECIEGACIDACEGDADCEGITNTYDGGGYVCK